MERLKQEMNQIEIDGKAKVASINLEREKSLQRLEEEKSQRLREHQESARKEHNADVKKFSREVKEKQTKIKTKHRTNMDYLNNFGRK